MACLILLLLALALNAGAEPWVRLYGGEGDQRATAVVASREGGYLFTGATTRPGEQSGDLWLVAVDEAGTLRWERQVGVKKRTVEGHDLVQLQDGSVVVVGLVKDARKQKRPVAGLVKGVSPTGTDLWQMEMDSLNPRCLLPLGDALYVAGGFQGQGGAWLGKLDPARRRWEWNQRFFCGDSASVGALALMDDTTLEMVGLRGAAGAFCAVVDTAGTLRHAYRTGTPHDLLRGVAVHGDTITAVGGHTNRDFVGNRVYNDFILRLDAQCRPLDSLRLSTREVEILSAVQVDGATVMCAGLTADDPSLMGATAGIQLAAWDASLKPLSRQRYAGLHYGAARDLLPLPDGWLVAGVAHREARDTNAQAVLFRVTRAELELSR